ncbi:MAG: hypothetical protein ACOC83_06540 [Gemmatimonadota bacterium]
MSGHDARSGQHPVWDRKRWDRLEARVRQLEDDAVTGDELDAVRAELGETRRWAFRTAIGVLTLHVTVLGGIAAALLGAL